jgi:hypothetical protein
MGAKNADKKRSQITDSNTDAPAWDHERSPTAAIPRAMASRPANEATMT